MGAQPLTLEQEKLATGCAYTTALKSNAVNTDTHFVTGFFLLDSGFIDIARKIRNKNGPRRFYSNDDCGKMIERYSAGKCMDAVSILSLDSLIRFVP